ncbi:MAG: UbiD family decarboxylase [Caldisphaera sp.]
MTTDYKDLREWLKLVRNINQLVEIENTTLDELRVITLVNFKNKGPATLFRNVQGYGKYGVLTNFLNKNEHIAITFGLDPNLKLKDIVETLRDKNEEWLNKIKDYPPKFVNDGPIMQNIKSGDEVDLNIFPVPKWNILDGGPYIGTADAIITKDPETDWVNLGVYRSQLFNKNEVGLWIAPARHGDILIKKYFEQNKPAPVVLVYGLDPLLFIAATEEVPYGISEYNYAGAVMGESVHVIKGLATGLPIPANAEIAAEGYIEPNKLAHEGPFAEYPGHYSQEGLSYRIKIVNLYYRNDAIITGMPPGKDLWGYFYYRSILRSSLIWNKLLKIGIPGIKGVWVPECGVSRVIVVVSIKQLYPGHAMQTAVLASQIPEGFHHNKYVIVVDDDVDPYDIEDVLWAVSTRTDPKEDIDIIRRTQSTPLDPRIKRPTNDWTSSVAIIRAVRPFDWITEFPKTAVEPEESRKKIFEKYKNLFNWTTY